MPLSAAQWDALQSAFGDRLETRVALARYTAARVGGPADAMFVARSVDDLAGIVVRLWDLEIPFFLLGGGANVLISDAGLRGVVVLNQASETEIDEAACSVWAGSGAGFGQMARRVSARGFGGLEWATGIPGTVGGAIYGNAGAHGGEVSRNLRLATILHRNGRREDWPAERLGFGYRTSVLKRERPGAVILAAAFALERSTKAATGALVEKFADRRKRTQPPGASMGSMFKNPPGDHAGRLIEAAGLKGTRIGGAEVSPVHANFFVNHAGATAQDIYDLIELTRKTVLDRTGIALELEIELVGEFVAPVMKNPDTDSTDVHG